MTANVADATPNVTATLIDALIASNRGDRHAFEFARKTYSYQDVAALMNRSGNMVRKLGVTAEDRVLLLVPESPAFVASLLGVMKAGAVPIVGAPIDGAAALANCIAAAAPVAAIVHETFLGNAATALDAIPRDAIIIVGTDVRGYKSFIDEVRSQPSWLAADPVRSDAPALDIWNGSSIVTIAHGDIGELINGDGNLANQASTAQSRVAAILRAFSTGDTARLE